MHFFHRRGILNLDGLCIFRGDDFWEAQDPDCKPLFQSNRFVCSLDKICYFISWKNSNALKEIVAQSINSCCSGLSKIEEAVDKERRSQPASGCRLAGWQLMGIKEVIQLESKIQNSGSFDLLSERWSLDGFSHFMSFLSKETCIKSGSMALPLDLIACSANAREGLTQALRTKELEKMKFQFDNPKRQAFQHGNTLLAKFPDAYSTCVKAMVEGFSAPTCSIQELTLQNMDLNHIEADYGNLGKYNPFNALFSRDSFAQLKIVLKPGDTEEDGPDPSERFLALQEIHPEKGRRVGRLNLYGVDIGMQGWEAMWANISKLECLEGVALDMSGYDGIDLRGISMALSTASSLPKLRLLFLEEHECIDTLDLTETLSNLLTKGIIEAIAINGSHHDGEDHCYEVDLTQICKSLKENRSLTVLRICTANLVRATGVSVARMLMDILHQSNNTSLQRVTLSDGKKLYTGTGADSWRFGETAPYENFEDALQLECMLKLNNVGLGQIRERGATKQDLVSCIVESYEYFFLDVEEEASFRRQVVALSSNPALNDVSNNGLGNLYEKLLASPKLWSGVGNDQLEHLGVVYGLLHARPDLWCNEGGDSTSLEPPSKRPRVCWSDVCHR